MQKNNEEKIICLFNGGDESAFETVYNYSFSAICYFVNKIVKNRDVACDIVQELFINIWNKKLKFQNITHLKSFLYKSAQYKAFSYLEKEHIRENIKNKITFPESIDPEDFSLYEIEADIFEQIFLAIEELPEECSRIFKMSYLENMDVKTISQKLDIAASTIMTQRQRAKKHLKDKFKNIDYIMFLCSLMIK